MNKKEYLSFNIKHLFILLICLSVLFCVTGCTEQNNENVHEHQYSDNYEYNGTEHWRQSLCGHEPLVIDEEPHTFGDWMIKQEATEKNEGIRVRICTKCHYEEFEYTKPLEHKHTYDIEHWSYNETIHYHSATCGHDERIDQQTHTFQETIITEPTETSQGYKEKKCTVCGYVTGENIPELEHKHKFEISYISEEEAGHRKFYYCPGCGYSYEGELESHNYRTDVVHQDSTCTENGFDIYRCESCDWKYTVKYELLKHELTHYEENPSTCVKRGNKEYYVCNNCGTYFWDANGDLEIYDLEEIYLDLAEHKYSLWEVVTEPTIYYDGEKIRTCEVCGDVQREKIDQLDHECDYSEKYNITFEGHVYDPHCYVCGSDLDEKITHHTYEYGKCTECGFDLTTYTEIKLPEGTNVGQNAFKNCTNLKKISLPDDLQSVGDSAFEGCINLTDVALKKGSRTLLTNSFYGNYAFKNCSKLTMIIIPEDANYISDYAFYGCSSLKSISMPESIDRVGQYAFYGCKSLSEYDYYTNRNIFQNIRTVRNYAFYDCDSIKSVYLFKYYQILEYAFANCDSLSSVQIIPDTTKNQEFSRIEYGAFFDCPNLKYFKTPYIFDGIINNYDTIESIEVTQGEVDLEFMKDSNLQTVLLGDNVTKIKCNNLKALKTITIGSGITSIANYAFSNCESLTTVKWHNNITSIGNYAFNRCSSLTNISIPTKCNYIGESAFSGCSSLQTLVLPDSVEILEIDAFSYCSGLTNVVLNNTLETLTSLSFGYCTGLETFVIPDNIKTIESYALAGCDNLISLYVSKNITRADLSFLSSSKGDDQLKLSNLYFSGNVRDWINLLNNIHANNNTQSLINYSMAISLENIYFLNDNDKYELVTSARVTSNDCIILPDYTFYGFPNLVSVNIENGVKEIGGYAFSKCKALTTVLLSNGIEKLGMDSFSYDISLQAITLPNSITVIGSGSFANCTSLESITLPNKLTIIEGYLFRNCKKIRITELPDSITTIWECAFENCSNLSLKKLPSKLENLYNYAFYNARLVPGIELPESIKIIAQYSLARTGYEPTIGYYNACSFILNNNEVTIKEHAFDLSMVLFKGSKVEFKTLFPDLTLKYIHYYSKEKPTYQGNDGYWYYTNENKPVDWLDNSPFTEFVTINTSTN